MPPATTIVDPIAPATWNFRGDVIDACGDQVLVAGSYASTDAVDGAPLEPISPPIAYSLPLDAATSANCARMVFIGAIGCHALVDGS